MSAHALQEVLTDCTYLEGPRWHDRALYVSDFYDARVIAVDSDGSSRTVVEVPGQPSGLGWTPAGDLLVVSMKDRRLLRWDGTVLHEVADLSGHAPSDLNELLVDTSGRAYVGNLGSDMLRGEPLRSTVLLRVDPDGSVHTVAEDLLVPNGMVLSPDGATLTVVETFAYRLTRFDVDAAGNLSNRRPWCEFDAAAAATTDFGASVAAASVIPDGMCLDAAGAVWVADAAGGRALRVLDGRVVAEIAAGAGLRVVATALGGAEGRTLFLCATPEHLEDDCRRMRGARVLAVDVDVPHAGLP